MFFQAFAIYCKNVAMYCKTVEFAMQIQQETLRLWVNQWSRATAAAVGWGRTDQVQIMQKRQLENSTERLTKLRAALDTQSKSGIRAIEDESPITEAATTLRRHGALDLYTAAPQGTTTAPGSAPTRADAGATASRTGEGARIQLREEELQVHKQLVEVGEVRVRKEVVTEHRTIEVPVQREEIVIERHAPNGAPVPDSNIGPGEEIRIPVREEQIFVEKRPVVKEEVTVGKRVVRDTERVGGEVRKEKVRVEREGDVDIRETAS